jgi:ribosomal protein L11 methylase PrmA
MSSALEAFKAQREAVDQVNVRLAEVAELVRSLQTQVESIGRDQQLREVLRDEQNWLQRAERFVVEVRALREEELRRFWPAVWRRWLIAVAFALAAAAAFGAGHVWATRPYEDELVTLRSRVELLDFVAQRIITMTPSERRQFDALIKGRETR